MITELKNIILFRRSPLLFLVIILTWYLFTSYIIRESNIDINRVNEIRSSASERIPWAYGYANINKKIQGNNAHQIFQMYEQNMGGVDCSGAAYSLMKLYKQYGFDSYEYHYGKLSEWNHVVTLVKIQYKGKEILVIEDPLFNVTYEYKDGSPIDFYDFLRLIKENKQGDIVMRRNNDQKHLYICDKRDSCPPPSNKNKISKIDERRTKYQAETYFEELERNYTSFLYPRFLQGSIDGVGVKELMEKIKSVINSKVQ